MALGLAFLRLQDKKETLTASLTIATERAWYTWILTRAFPLGQLNNNHRSDRNGVLFGGKVWQSEMKLGKGDLQTNNSGLKPKASPGPSFIPLTHIGTVLISDQQETRPLICSRKATR